MVQYCVAVKLSFDFYFNELISSPPVSPVPPVLGDVPAELSVELGSPLSLPCTVLSALPRPSLLWHHDGLPVTDGGGRRLEADGALRLAAARRRDAGLYTCTAGNIAGATSVTTRVNVHCENRGVGTDVD